jgi:hypothetical protein
VGLSQRVVEPVCLDNKTVDWDSFNLGYHC